MALQNAFVSSHSEGKHHSDRFRIPFLKDIIAFFRFMTDPEVRWYNKGLVIAAFAYVFFPADAIPDVIPLIGFLDDLGVIILVVRYLRRQLIPYYR